MWSRVYTVEYIRSRVQEEIEYEKNRESERDHEGKIRRRIWKSG